jgi:hypothetical protein
MVRFPIINAKLHPKQSAEKAKQERIAKEKAEQRLFGRRKTSD